ncbi:MAG TPA: PASTA domain-containing protein [Leptolinea sp.]
MNSFSSFIAGRCVVSNATRHGQGFQLTDTAQQLVTAQRMDEFKTAFGDMFARSLMTGGEFDVVVRITSVDEQHQSKLSSSLHAEYDGLMVSGSFQAAFNTAMQETNNQTEVTVFMSQAGGIGGQVSFTGPDSAKILQRLSEFPASVHDHPVGYEVEMANYNTIPLPIPTAEEREDRQIVLQDCFAQKMGFLKALADMDFLLSENASLFFDNLPPQEVLLNIQGQYRTALNALMAWAINIATGKMDPPQTFVANPAPAPLNFKKKPFNAAPVTIPDWSRNSVEDFSNPGANFITPASLGLIVTIVGGAPVTDPEGNDEGDVVSISPPPGTVVPRGSSVTVYVKGPASWSYQV